jgi:hypothetical protein
VLIEDTIRIILADKKFSILHISISRAVLADVSFLPYSDIDLMIISESIEKDEHEIKK